MTDRAHPVRIRWYRGTPEELGREIMRCRYDFVRGVLHGMAIEASEQMQGDSGCGRRRLAGILYEAYSNLAWARRHLARAWVLCSRHMGDELRKDRELSDGRMPGVH